MSWIIRDLWKELDTKFPTLEPVSYRTFSAANEIAARVGEEWGLMIQLNYPAGKIRPSILALGRENVSLLVETGRKRFQGVSETEVRKHIESLGNVKLETAGHGYEGYRAILGDGRGRIDCLPGGVHLWCVITPDILGLLDWLFENAYGIGSG